MRTCRQLLKREEALWLFTEVPGVEPTNNANVLSFLTDAVEAARHQTEPPSLLPESPKDSQLEQLAA